MTDTLTPSVFHLPENLAARVPFAELYERVADRLRRYANHLEPRWCDGEDLLQEAAIRMYKKYAQFEPGTDFEAWSKRVVFRVFCSRYRKDRRAVRLRDAAPASATWLSSHSTQSDVERACDREIVETSFRRFSPCIRKTFELRYRGWSYVEIADALEIPVGTAKSRVSHARKLLRQWYAELHA